MIKTYIIVALVSYLLGSIPFGYILVKLFLKQDIRSTGSGNIGATNVARSGAKGLAVATLVLDAAKGWVAVCAALWILDPVWAPWSQYGHFCVHVDNPPIFQVFAAPFAILGHVFPVWLRFKGGKGVATAAGAFLSLAPAVLVPPLIVFVIVVAIFRYVSLGSILAAVTFPVSAYFQGARNPLVVVAIVFSSGLIILKHHENIRRLLAGTESKFGRKRSVPPPDAMEKQA